MKNLKKLLFFAGASAVVGLFAACSSDASLGDDEKSSDQNVDQGGSAASSSAGKASGGSSGATPSCADAQCVRAIECVASCAGPVLQSGCCPCDAGTFDRQLECPASSGGTAGSGGGSGTGNTGSSAGGMDGQAGAAPTEPATGLNASCVDDACPDGLTPIHFYGVAGTAGPQFCWCTIPCADDPKVCPTGTSCTTISDGPGTVCFAQR